MSRVNTALYFNLFVHAALWAASSLGAVSATGPLDSLELEKDGIYFTIYGFTRVFNRSRDIYELRDIRALRRTQDVKYTTSVSVPCDVRVKTQE